MIFSTKKPRARRSGKWSGLRNRFLKGKRCAVCEGVKQLEAHHVIPFHVNPDLELAPSNLLALCEGRKSINCHLIIGHLGNYRASNPKAIEDAERWKQRMLKR